MHDHPVPLWFLGQKPSALGGHSPAFGVGRGCSGRVCLQVPRQLPCWVPAWCALRGRLPVGAIER